MISGLVVISWIVVGSTTTIASAFQSHRLPSSSALPKPSKRRAVSSCTTKLDSSLGTTVIDISEGASRDDGVAFLSQWATGYGVQTSDGFQLASEDGLDVFVITNQDLPEGSPILFIPNDLLLTGSKARQEFGADAYDSEQIIRNSQEASDRVSQFYLFLKVLKEFELGEESAWHPWLNSLPRYYSNGASMTDFCFGCLPPYAAEVSLAEKKCLFHFVRALGQVPFLSSKSKSNADLTKWAFAVVNTRCSTMPDGDICLAPMADFFNHGAEENAYITYDEEGNCYAYSTCDVPAGQPLQICYGDPTNPSNLLARYGFLDESSPATFCKIVINNPSPELVNMGYDPSRMLFYKDGGISQEVWDVLLFQELGKVSSEEQQGFYQAHMMGDEASKQQYHEQYFPQTLAAMQKHVDFLVDELEELGLGLETQVSQGLDAWRHPRLPLIMRHNEYVRNIFELIQQNLDNMYS